MRPDGLVIVGAGLAGAKAAEAARDRGWSEPIRLVGAEPHLPYERPALSKTVMLGRVDAMSTLVHEGAFYATNEIDLLVGTAVQAVDPAANVVQLEGGRRLCYERLVLATGSTPRALPLPGSALPEVFVLRTVDDALRIRDHLVPGRRVAVIGGSWIGTEVAACARQRGCDVAIVEPMQTLLERTMGRAVGRFYEELHRGQGVDLHLGSGVDAIEGTARVEGVRLSSGDMVEADLVVVGVGVRPNTELAVAAGLDVAEGVLADAMLRSSHPDVYVAGDIAEADHPVLGRRMRVEHWANALNQGRVAGNNAAGGRERYERIPYFYSDQYTSSMEYSGWPVAFDRVVMRGDPGSGSFVAFYLAAERVVAGANVNAPGLNEHVQRLVRNCRVVDDDRLADLTVDPGSW